MYAVHGPDGWVYFGQIATNGDFAFYRHRSSETADAGNALVSPIMSRFSVDRRSVGVALRQGVWVKLTKHAMPPALMRPCPYVQWPVGTAMVTVWSRAQKDGGPTHETTIDDPLIQAYEVGSSWDAVHHVPERLQLDFGDAKPEAWQIGGPVWRQRRVAVEIAKRHPSMMSATRAAHAMLATDY